MPLTFNQRATVTIPLLDATGSIAQLKLVFRVPSLNELDTIIPQIVNGIPSITSLSGASARGMNISLGWSDNNPQAPLSGSRVERIGQWLLAAGQKAARITIPAIKNELVDGVGYIIRSNPAVQAFETFLLSGSTASNIDGTEFSGVLDAREVFKASGKRAPRLRG